MASSSVTPITLLSGFLSAGKTTLLKELLQNKAGLKVGILVNDVAEINIDAALVSKRTGGEMAKEDTVELQNGCACCSAAEEFLQGIESLMKLSRERGTPWDHIVIEGSGVAEPREIRDNFRNALVSSPEMLEGTKLHTMVTVVDGSTFLEEFEKRNKLNERPDLGSGEFVDTNRQVVDLMCEQIECADILVLNKMDLVKSADELALLREAVSSLNSGAEVHTSERGRVELVHVLGAAKGGGVAEMDEDMEHRRAVEAAKEAHSRTDHSHAGVGRAELNGHADGSHAQPAPVGDAGVSQNDGGDHARETNKSFGITSFCYQRRRPFHPHRLMGVIRDLPVRLESLALSEALLHKGDGTSALAEGRSPMQCLIRSKGFVWLSNSHSQMFYWALAGKHFDIKHHGEWWASHPRSEWPTGEKEIAEIRKAFEGDMGDRRQELVFTGVNMDARAITKLLDDCLLSEAEMAEYRKREADEPGSESSAGGAGA